MVGFDPYQLTSELVTAWNVNLNNGNVFQSTPAHE
jgi:hypothetical protein